jgi:ABC-type branched-subunit amino acid transport system substrate-binding protein
MRSVPGGDRGRAVPAALLALCLASPPGVAALDEAASRGKQIYLQGTSPGGGAIEAVVGDEAVTLPASAVPCASCHGPDGQGRPEGGVLPPDIRWSQLTKVYGHVHENGRRHPAFDEASVARLLRTGRDPADNALDRAMPLYRMSETDMDDLVAYLKQLESDRDPGIESERVQVGSLLPLRGPLGRLGQAMAQVMHAYFQDVNAEGGVYGRRIDLLTVPFGDSSESTLETLQAALRREGIFALVGAYTVGLDQELLELLRTEGVPLVAPFTLDPGDGLADASAFYLYPGFDEQVRVLADQALGDAAEEPARVVIVGPEGGRVDRMIAAVRDQLRGRVPSEPPTIRYGPGGLDADAVAAQIADGDASALLFLGRQAGLRAVLDALARSGSGTRIYLLSSFVSGEVLEAPPEFNHRIFIAYPTLTSDVSEEGKSAYRALAERHALPRDHLQAQMTAYAAAKLLVEGVRRAGRDLDRVGLVEGLEALYEYDTGVTPRLTYGPNRRIGARGAHVVSVNLETKAYEPVGGWHELR